MNNFDYYKRLILKDAINEYKQSILQCEKDLFKLKELSDGTLIKSDITSLFWFPETCIKSLKQNVIDFEYVAKIEAKIEPKLKTMKAKKKAKSKSSLTKFQPVECEQLIKQLKNR